MPWILQPATQSKEDIERYPVVPRCNALFRKNAEYCRIKMKEDE
jgi:uncharacterized C2H2 Zn-finger protein